MVLIVPFCFSDINFFFPPIFTYIKDGKICDWVYEGKIADNRVPILILLRQLWQQSFAEIAFT